MKKTLFILVFAFLLGSLTSCVTIVLSPEIYGPPYYTGPAYLYPAPITVVPAPIIMVPAYYHYSFPYYYPYHHHYYRRK